jgi:phosphohistidine phosphatase
MLASVLRPAGVRQHHSHMDDVRRLILLRHAKSDWPMGVPDHDRPLGERGRIEAPLAGRWLAAQGLVPDVALVSTATRARETWLLAAAQLDAEVPTRFEDALYDAAVWDVVVLLRSLPDDVVSAIVVGHNPATERLAMTLDDGQGPAGHRERLVGKYPTSGIAVLALHVPRWSELDAASARLEAFEVPRR